MSITGLSLSKGENCFPINLPRIQYSAYSFQSTALLLPDSSLKFLESHISPPSSDFWCRIEDIPKSSSIPHFQTLPPTMSLHSLSLQPKLCISQINLYFSYICPLITGLPSLSHAHTGLMSTNPSRPS